MVKRKSKGNVPTVDQMVKDRITTIASRYWAPYTSNHAPFDAKVVADLYKSELIGSMFSVRKIMLLEFSQYLENYLWPNYDIEHSSIEHVMSIIVMVNEKFRERVPAWNCFIKHPERFVGFFRRVMDASLEEESLIAIEQTCVITFLVHCFNSMEIDLIRSQIQKIMSLPVWINLLPAQREQLFKQSPKLKKYFNVIKKHDAKLTESQLEVADFERKFMVRMIDKFFKILESIGEDDVMDEHEVKYCERFLELMIDLEALLPTRRFFNALLHSNHVLTRCILAPLCRRGEGKLFTDLLKMLRFYARFEINDLTGQQLTEGDMTDLHYNSVTSLQKAAFKYFKEEMKEFYLLNVAAVDTRKALTKQFQSLSKESLYNVAEFLHLVPSLKDDKSLFEAVSKEFLAELLVSHHERRPSQIQLLNEMPLYPTEEVIWDENVVPYENFTGDGCLALNKLNLQFLTLHDYLLRNFNLFQMESTYEIRQDLEDILFRMKPWKHERGEGVVFGGWARMALQLTSFTIVEVSKPNIGEKSPSSVRADITLTLSKRGDIRSEWESLRKHDVLFLVTCRPDAPVGTKYKLSEPFKKQIQIAYIRGCEVEGMVGPDGKIIEEFGPDPKPVIPGDARTFRVWLDNNQYRLDMEKTVQGHEDPYETFNLLVRRNPKSNNFKAVLDTIRQLMNTSCVVPDWLHDLILGYGTPDSAHYSKLNQRISKLDFNDTFLDYDHLNESFPDYKITATTDDDDKLIPPFTLTFKDLEAGQNESSKEIVVEPFVIPSRGPYPYSEPKRNSIKFTPTQVEAIKSGMQPGLTMVVGPPGTGKTDVAVQIISNIYHNWPEQRTLLVTHSNQALNQLFEKIMKLDVDERHLLRLGHGEESLETEKDFSRYGRVNYVLAKRLELLAEVDRLQQSLGVAGDVSYTCETAGHFFLYQIYARWEEFMSKMKRKPEEMQPETAEVAKYFPFNQFFSNAPQPLFRGFSFEEDFEIAQSCWRHLKRIFEQLEEFRASELLRSGRDRTEYLLVKEAKIIAMTCTHAALRRKDMVQLGFKYDNILMEESAQILEIETFIPLLLQNPRDGHNRLKRWIMIGDHHQLPPIIQNMAFQKYSNMEQSLFARFVRLGVPTVQLDAQGRSRSSIAALYNWRYKNLGNLPHVEARPEFKRANAGFLYDYQLINVGDFNGIGESTPSAYFYQNLAEAEYAAAIFTYMRLLGYPADKISMLTTYNGQKHLLRDVVEKRCSGNPMLGRPHKIQTVDKFQGQQNDYIILSLVRTQAVGHIRDVRRLIVAMSRARLGLYVLARVGLFQNCFELTPAFNILCQRPLNLMLIPNEVFPTMRETKDAPQMQPLVIQNMSHMAQFVFEFYRQNIDAFRSTYHQQMEAHLHKADEQVQENDNVETIDTANQELSEEKAVEEQATSTDIEFETLETEEPIT